MTVASARIAPSRFEEIIARLDGITSDELDTLPIGMIQLDREGRVVRYNSAEGRLADRDPRQQIGRSFFDEVAPCTKVKEFYGRFREGIERKQLYETFGFTFRFATGNQDVAITLFYSQATDSMWVLVSRKGEALDAAKARLT